MQRPSHLISGARLTYWKPRRLLYGKWDAFATDRRKSTGLEESGVQL